MSSNKMEGSFPMPARGVLSCICYGRVKDFKLLWNWAWIDGSREWNKSRKALGWIECGGATYTLDHTDSALRLFRATWAVLPLVILFIVLYFINVVQYVLIKALKSSYETHPYRHWLINLGLWSEMKKKKCVRNAPLSANVLTSQVALCQC